MRKILLASAGGLALVSGIALAASYYPPRPVYSIGEQGVIFYENGKETLVLSTSFSGKAQEFAWVIPTPGKPDLGKVSNELFTALNERTSQRLEHPGDVYPVPLASPSIGEGSARPKVVVEDTKEIGYYDAVVLSATDKAGLLKWFSDEGYNFPSTDSYLLDDYVKDNWHFTVVRIKPEYAGETVTQSLNKEHSSPLVLTFDAPKMVYPLKLASVRFERSSSPTSAPVFIDGKFGKAARLRYGDYLQTSLSDVQFSEGSVTFWLRAGVNVLHAFPELFRLQTGGGNVRDGITKAPNRISLYLSNGDLIVNGSLGDGSLPNKGFVNIPWRLNEWNFVVLNWRANGESELFVNGTKYPLGYGGTALRKHGSGSTEEGNADVFLGTFGSNVQPQTYWPVDLDETKLYSSPLNENEVQQAYSGAVVPGRTAEMSASFEGTLAATTNSDKEPRLLSLLQTPAIQTPSYDYNYQDQFPLVLYVIGNHRMQATGFGTEYAGKISSDELNKLVPEGDSWVHPKDKSYFLTRLTREVQRSAVDSDIYPQQAPTDALVNAPDPDALSWFWAVVVVSLVVTVGAAYFLVTLLRSPRSMAH